jgi:hypothetical protein
MAECGVKWFQCDVGQMLTMGGIYQVIGYTYYQVKSAARDSWDSILHAVFTQGP